MTAWIRAREKSAAEDSGDEMMAGMAGSESPVLERYREERWKLAQLDRLEREKTLLPIDEVHEVMVMLARIMRGIGENMQRRGLTEAYEMLSEGLDDYERELVQRFGDADPDRLYEESDENGRGQGSAGNGKKAK